jgi:hypothetical protein
MVRKSQDKDWVTQEEHMLCGQIPPSSQKARFPEELWPVGAHVHIEKFIVTWPAEAPYRNQRQEVGDTMALKDSWVELGKTKKIPNFKEMILRDELKPTIEARINVKSIEVHLRIATDIWYDFSIAISNMKVPEEVKNIWYYCSAQNWTAGSHQRLRTERRHTMERGTRYRGDQYCGGSEAQVEHSKEERRHDLDEDGHERFKLVGRDVCGMACLASSDRETQFA